MIIFHDPRCTEYSRAGHPERPARISATVPLLKQLHPSWEWREAEAASTEQLLRAHTAEHVESVRTAREDFDADSPAHPHLFEHASRAAGAALQVAKAAAAGERAFSLMRPPGHHATRERAMGFCYFSNIAVAALHAMSAGANRVGIWDFDAHHGNGTEDVVACNDRVAFASIHQFPGYPGTGTTSFANIYNYPVAPRTPRAQHVSKVEQALEKLLSFNPDLILVSAGLDAYAKDPLTEMRLEPDDFATFGQWLRQCGTRSGAILEGGYSDDLPELIDAFLTAWELTESDQSNS